MKVKKIISIFALTTCLVSLGVADLHGSSVLKRNLKELTAIAELIIVGEVVSVTDGLDGNFPYTEVTIEVSQSIKGISIAAPIAPDSPQCSCTMTSGTSPLS